MQLVQLVDSLHSYIMHQAIEPALARWTAASAVLRGTVHGTADDATLAALVAAHEALVQDVWTGCLLDDDVSEEAGFTAGNGAVNGWGGPGPRVSDVGFCSRGRPM